MQHLREANWEENCNFRGRINEEVGYMKNDCHFYKSFKLKGVRYFLYDSVFAYQEDYPEAHIGKIVEIYKTPADEMRMKLVWFFRPHDIRNFLNDYKPSWKEIFLASGKGRGLSNVSPLEAVMRKCYVLCASNDRRNPQASKVELNTADYIFSRTFDVAKLKIEESFPEEIDGVKVEHFFNPRKDQALVNAHSSEENVRMETGKSSSSLSFGSKKVVSGTVKLDGSGIKLSPVVKGVKKPAFNVGEQGYLLRPKSTAAKCATGERYEKNIDGLGDITGWTGESSSSSRLRLEKAVHSAFPDDNCGNKMNPVVKGSESKKAAVSVDQQVYCPSDRRKKDETLFWPLKPKARVSEWTGKSILCPTLELDKVVGHGVKASSSGIRVSSVMKETAAPNADKQRRFSTYDASLGLQTSDNDDTVRKIRCSQLENRAKMRCSEYIIQQSASDIPLKRRRLLQCEESKYLDVPTTQHVPNRGMRTVSLNMEVTRRPDSDRKSWFKELPWEKRLRKADEEGTLVYLENLDPSYTSPEVEYVVVNFVINVAGNFSPTAYEDWSLHLATGKALVIFKSKDAADTAISKLRRRCLMLAGGRPVVGTRGILPEPDKPADFVGHLILDKLRHKKMNIAGSTSHCSQPNTLEYYMAIEWCIQQATSDLYWKKLHEQQAKEIRELTRKMKRNYFG
ncbi:protein ANTI-SILENCING 1 isoform X4 [Mangifera indica]|uniref:protein ANTI-SILENCING 1 isoform X4 n=1 Tax=Mangifera indica TaxID=29780 RepID=UPI001CF9920F|nr:protein ANTI-SILENCING 1 isoform X4 [Mangifera indica]